MAKKKKAKKEPMLQAYGGIAVVFSLIVLLHESTGFLGQFFYQLSRFLFGNGISTRRPHSAGAADRFGARPALGAGSHRA